MVAGTLALSVDERGLPYDISAPDTQTIHDLVLALMQRGDIDQINRHLALVLIMMARNDEGIVSDT